MADLILPQPAAAATDAATPASAAEQIRALARLHEVTATPVPLDAFAADISRLSDAEVAPDVLEDLLQALTRAGIITHAQRFALHAAYLREGPRTATAAAE